MSSIASLVTCMSSFTDQSILPLASYRNHETTSIQGTVISFILLDTVTGCLHKLAQDRRVLPTCKLRSRPETTPLPPPLLSTMAGQL